MRRRAAAAVVVAVLLTPARGHAHGGWAGAWTTDPGRVWGKLTFIYLRSDRLFADPISSLQLACGGVIARSDRIPYDCTTGGVFEVSALYTDLMVGIADGVDAWIQLPLVLRQSFWNDSGLEATRDPSLGDVRFGARHRLLSEPFLLAFGWQLEAPTGSFTTDEGVPATGEGQWDLSGQLLASSSIPHGYVQLDAGWRFRFANATTLIDPGDQPIAGAEVAWQPYPWLTFPLRLEYFWGLPSESPREPVPRPNVWALEATVGAFFQVERVGIDLRAKIPLVGEGWPALPTFWIGVWWSTPPLWT